MTTPTSTPSSGSRRRRERDAFSDKEAAKMLGIPVTKLYRICEFFDSDPDDAWDLIEGEFFEYEPGQARKRRFYEEGVMAIAKYLEEAEGGSFLARLKEFFTHHRARVTRALVQRRIIQVTQDRSTLVIRGDLVFLQQRSVVRVLGTNAKGMVGAVRRIDEESEDRRPGLMATAIGRAKPRGQGPELLQLPAKLARDVMKAEPEWVKTSSSRSSWGPSKRWAVAPAMGGSGSCWGGMKSVMTPSKRSSSLQANSCQAGAGVAP